MNLRKSSRRTSGKQDWTGRAAMSNGGDGAGARNNFTVLTSRKETNKSLIKVPKVPPKDAAKGREAG